MENQLFQLCDILRNMSVSANFGRRLEVSFPIFNGIEKWCIRQSLSQVHQLEKESVADYSHDVRTHLAG